MKRSAKGLSKIRDTVHVCAQPRTLKTPLMQRGRGTEGKRNVTIDLFHAATISHKNNTFSPSSLAMKNLRTSLDVEKGF